MSICCSHYLHRFALNSSLHGLGRQLSLLRQFWEWHGLMYHEKATLLLDISKFMSRKFMAVSDISKVNLISLLVALKVSSTFRGRSLFLSTGPNKMSSM